MPIHEGMDTDEHGDITGEPIIILVDKEGLYTYSPKQFGDYIQHATYAGDEPTYAMMLVKLPNEEELRKVEGHQTRQTHETQDESDGFTIGWGYELDLLGADDVILATISYYIVDH